MQFFPLTLFPVPSMQKNELFSCSSFVLQYSCTSSATKPIESLPLHKRKDQGQKGEQKPQVLEQALMDVKSRNETD